jgi:2,3-bisphosphoglycerate-independent phosphoglycerate mutase
VPLICVGWDGGLREGGRLADIAPTVLELLRIAKPEAMEGVSLLDRMA